MSFALRENKAAQSIGFYFFKPVHSVFINSHYCLVSLGLCQRLRILSSKALIKTVSLLGAKRAGSSSVDLLTAFDSIEICVNGADFFF